jgi:hypothetical protein
VAFPTHLCGSFHPATQQLIALLDSDDGQVVFTAIAKIYDRGIGKSAQRSA